MACCQLLLGLCFAYPMVKENISQGLLSKSDEERLEILGNLNISKDVLLNYIKSTVLNRIEPTLLTNEHLLEVNEATDSGLFFECFPTDGQKSNITPLTAKRKLVLHNKTHIERENTVFEQIAQQLQ